MTEGVMIVTGTRKGIGRHLAEEYAARGYHVVGCSRGESDFEHPRYEHHCLDVSDEKAVRKLFGAVVKRHGRVDVLINNAGVAAMNHFLLTPVSALTTALNTNVVGTFLFCREAAKLMSRRGGGRIVNLTTIACPLDLEGEATYAASKSAVEKMTRILAREVGKMNITVNAVGPSPVPTDLIGVLPDAKVQAILDKQAIQRVASCADVMNVIDFFIRPESEFITGQILYLGGV